MTLDGTNELSGSFTKDAFFVTKAHAIEESDPEMVYVNKAFTDYLPEHVISTSEVKEADAEHTAIVKRVDEKIYEVKRTDRNSVCL